MGIPCVPFLSPQLTSSKGLDRCSVLSHEKLETLQLLHSFYQINDDHVDKNEAQDLLSQSQDPG